VHILLWAHHNGLQPSYVWAHAPWQLLEEGAFKRCQGSGEAEEEASAAGDSWRSTAHHYAAEDKTHTPPPGSGKWTSLR